MKYTRYDLNTRKRKNERKKMFGAILGVVVVAVLVATVLWKFVLQPNMNNKGENTEIVTGEEKTNSENGSSEVNNDKESAEQPKEESTTNSNESESKQVSTNTGGTQEYVMVQCGVYSKKDNADSIIKQLENKTVAVSVLEKDQTTSTDRYRVIAYIGTEEEAGKLSGDFEAQKISTAKARFSIPKSDLVNSEIAEMINGYLKILEKLKDSEVKSVKTQEFKEWTKALEEDTAGKNYGLFKELKETIINLPEEVSKDNIGDGYQVVYKVLNNFRINN